MEMTHLRELTLTDIAEMDGGRIGVAMAHAINRAADDIYDRPGESKARKIVLEVLLTPECGEDGECENVKMQAQVKDTIPSRKTRLYDLGVRRRNGRTSLVYSDAAPDNHMQPGLPMDEDAE